MAVVFLDQIEFSKIPGLNFVLPVVTSDPSGLTAADEGRLIYNTTSNEVKYCNESLQWIAFGPAGAGGPPTGSAGGDLTGSYPGPQIAALAVTDAKVAAANKDGATGTPSMRTLGTGATQAAAGNDSRFTDSRTPSGSAGGDLTGTYPSPQIAAGVIVDNDISGTAAIQTSKISGLDTALTGKASTTVDLTVGAGLTGGGTIASNRTFTVGAGTGITVNADDVAINRTTTDTWYLQLSGGTLTNFLTLHADPTNPLHAATKQYVDITSQGYSFKNAVRAVSATQRALTGLTAIDGVTPVANDRILLAGQTAPAENGIWLAQSGAWGRATDMDASGELKDGTLVTVAEGTTGGDSQWMCTATTATPWIPGTSGSTWTKYTSLSDLSAGAGMTKTGNTLDVVSANADLTVGADSITIVSAPKWTTGRTITLSGTVAGTSSSWDGSGNATLTTTNVAGAIVNADINASAAIATSKISGLDTALTGKASTATTITAGAGLTGGGDLTANRTLDVVSANADMTVGADSITINSAPRWTTTRTITLTGDVTSGAVNIDGTGNVSIATTAVGAGTTAAKHYAVNVGAGTAIVINHALNSRDINVEVYRNSTPWDTVNCTVERTDVNNVTLRFAAAVGANAYRCVVTGK